MTEVIALHDRAEKVRQAEIKRFRNRLGKLDENQVDAIDALTRSIIYELLHDRLIMAVHELFAIEEATTNP